MHVLCTFLSNGLTSWSKNTGNGCFYQLWLEYFWLKIILKWILWGHSKCGEISLITSCDRAMYQYCVKSVFHLAKYSLVICTKKFTKGVPKRPDLFELRNPWRPNSHIKGYPWSPGIPHVVHFRASNPQRARPPSLQVPPLFTPSPIRVHHSGCLML